MGRMNINDIWEINHGLGIPPVAGVEMLGALSNDYYCVYYIDFDKDTIAPYRVAKAILADYRDLLSSESNYTTVLTTYADTTVVPADREMFKYNIRKDYLIKQLEDTTTFQFDFRAIIKGQVMFCRTKVVDVSQNEDEHIAVMGFSNVSREVSKQIERFAFVDELTGGDNYHMFKQNMEDATENGFIISIDIRSFKVINASCGAATGDEVIKRMWRKILGGLEEGEYAGHINGDRFVAFMPTDDEEEVIAKMNRLSDAISSIAEDINVPKLEAYYGVARWKTKSPVEEAVTRANEAQHQIRDEKEINYAFYTQEDLERLLDETQMEQSFSEAIATKQFEVWYQPKYSPAGDKIVGAEALVRWRKPDGSLWPPGQFIPLFERDGLIRRLDEYVFQRVCEDQKRWKDEGVELIPISVNLSRASLYYEGVAERYIELACENGIDAKWIPIEITESAAADNDHIHEIIDIFSDGGFYLHMDDFGTGYSSLSMLNKYNFDTLKLDKSLIDYIGNYSGDRLLMHTISLAKDLGMQVVAEGVEEESQIGFLKKTACDSVQGYIYSKPLEYDDFYQELTTKEHGVSETKRDIDRESSKYKSNLEDILKKGQIYLNTKALEAGIEPKVDIFVEEPMVYLNQDIFIDGAFGMIETIFSHIDSDGDVKVVASQKADVSRGTADLFVQWTCSRIKLPTGFDREMLSLNTHMRELSNYLDDVGADVKVKYDGDVLVASLRSTVKLVMTE